MFKTLSDIKKATQVGTYWLTIWKDGTKKERKIIHKQSNAIKFENGSWLYWDTAGHYDILENGFICYWTEEKSPENEIMRYYIL